MKKIILKFVFGILLLPFWEINSQPYIYYSTQIIDTTFGVLEKSVRYNLLTNSVEDFLPLQTLGKYVGNVWDPSQSYLIIYLYREGYNLYDCSNYSNSYDLGIWGTQIHEGLFSVQRNNLYIFSDEYKKLSTFNFSSNTIISEINLGKAGYNNDLMEPTRTSFFSSDSSKIYFYNLSTNDIDQVWTYSLDNNQIIQQINLAELGYPGSDGYDLNFGRNGKGIISSDPDYNNPVRDFYYRIYDFDNNAGSDFIYHNGLSEAYFANDGDLILIMNTFKDDSTWEYYHTGEGYIYKTSNGQLLKTLNLPSNGRIYTFDNYPNNIYYAIDIEEPTRQIYTLKMDSIFNVLVLTSLSPSSKIVNSSPFTLTINGHGFDSLSTVYFNDTAKTTTYISDSVLTTEIYTADISVVGNYNVCVTDQWATSDTLIFAVTPQPADLISLSPTLAIPYAPFPEYDYVTASVTGEFFTDSSVVFFNGYPKTTTYVSDSLVTFQLLSYNLVNEGDYPIWVSNYGLYSDTLILSITRSLPGSIIPILNCVFEGVAYFGYRNDNDVPVFIPKESKNMFSPSPEDRGQPNIFLPGEYIGIIGVDFEGEDVTWTLMDEFASTGKGYEPCGEIPEGKK